MCAMIQLEEVMSTCEQRRKTQGLISSKIGNVYCKHSTQVLIITLYNYDNLLLIIIFEYN